MTTPPTPPTPGKPISASFFARLIAWAKSGMLVEGTGYRLRRGPNGTALEIDVKSVAKPSKSPDLSCFCIKPSPKQEDAGALAFCNCFVSDGMVFKQVIEDGSYRVDQFVLQGELEEGREYTDDDRPYVYVQFYGGDHNINAQKTLEDVREIAKDPTQGTVLLLYKLKHDGSVAIDFRNMPIFQHVEAV